MNDQHKIRVAQFRLPPRYKNLRYIGEGAYGTVVAADDTEGTDIKEVAIKRLQPFRHKLMAQRTLREIRILQRLQHDNIISIINMCSANGDDNEPEDIYVIQMKMETDLHKVLKRTRLSPEHICFFTYQLLNALKFIHSANVIHRDLKPSNLLIDASTNCDLRVCDFGLARVLDPVMEHGNTLTEYVATRWYRAPEVMLQAKSYTKSIDIWSVGCVLGEMFDNRPMFPGKNYVEQLNLIIKVVGRPSANQVAWINADTSRNYLLSLPFSNGDDFTQRYPRAPSAAIDCLHRMLKVNPAERITAEDALAHVYMQAYHDPEDEPVCHRPFSYETELDETGGLDVLREKILQEVLNLQGINTRRPAVVPPPAMWSPPDAYMSQ
eukprot:m.95945 g.95945  ORF g.95945 m.95945 type:complete len:380 (-) comp26856_c0_seq1:318-1457(-)